ncbi:MAG TPA: hypothetical protein PKV16_03910 [Caldisericia bacterium]|nr:hypothetical protein [Caldisericia bacterium]HPF48455.1 hypothetical protein [Caldisericia bacterium]HPI83365.1 hypothetical protein [Caldisericia bacterium]HPQ92909.1 hypothetical protein [Caldisericia bacterium]HRV73993.1 hypothetical protein [Caldisericia bacterium]
MKSAIIRIALLPIVASVFLSCADSGNDWKKIEGTFFSLVTPSSMSIESQNDWQMVLTDGSDKITITWIFDQFSVKNIPPRESISTAQGEVVVESSQATLGDRTVWWSEIEGKGGLVRIGLTIPLDMGEVRLEGVTMGNPTNIKKSIRSITIDEEDYFNDFDS